MRWALPVVLLSGCGRLSFDATGDAANDDVSSVDALSGHDEDGDGVPDLIDVCPHYPDPTQIDTDLDRVGNACDPQPAVSQQRWLFFSPLAGPDSRIVTTGQAWTRGAEEWSVVSPNSGSNLFVAGAFKDIDVFVAIDLTSLAPTNRQLAIIIQNDAAMPYYYGELFDGTGSGAAAVITQFDGTSYTGLNNAVYGAFPVGRTTFMHLIARMASATFTLDVDGTVASAPTPTYTGAQNLSVGMGGCAGSVRYIAVVETLAAN
ncbi:MAG TPA: thrombospondin type 3 repeat-containing protein [Kofleriaceae bacterium]|nr:thrombospondin type 3 repeat-containing protein [Kofleriaceae bacterium]